MSTSDSKSSKKYQVKKEFLRISESEFLANFTQTRLLLPEYSRSKNESVIQFEFLLPLSKEEQLKRALDELFYSDSLEMRITELGTDNLSKIIPRDNLDEQQYREKVINEVSSYFSGYSISHVQGRFRASNICSRADAAELIRRSERYLIDETTALVRFIAPCNSIKQDFGNGFSEIIDALKSDDICDREDLEKEVELIRALFFFFFVETVIWTVQGEDEIWLLETGVKMRLYRWEKKN